MPDEIYYKPGEVIDEHGVLWKMHPTEDEPDPPFRLYGSWHRNLADALPELEAAAKNHRCAYAAVYTRSTTLWARTRNAVDGRPRDGQT